MLMDDGDCVNYRWIVPCCGTLRGVEYSGWSRQRRPVTFAADCNGQWSDTRFALRHAMGTIGGQGYTAVHTRFGAHGEAA